jgi:nitrate/nitrite transport system ATP-binding protein
MSPFLEISYVTKAFPTARGPVVIVDDFHLTAEKGEFISLIGHSGCGKSTVLAMVAGLTEPTTGGIIIENHEIAGPGPDRGVVFQAPCLLPWLSALDNVLLGVNQVFATAPKAERRELAAYFLELVGLGDALARKPGELSQGMRQRVGLARAFALSPQLLLLDEPFGMLDSLTRIELQDVLLHLWGRDQKTALMVTHDIDEALFLSDRIVMMTDGPAATIGEILSVPFPRPRNRKALLEDAEYYRLREQLIGFLEGRSHLRPARAANSGTRSDAPPPARRSAALAAA